MEMAAWWGQPGRWANGLTRIEGQIMMGAAREDLTPRCEREPGRVFNLGCWEGFPEEVAFEPRSEDWNPPHVLGEVRTLLGQTN